MPLALNGKYVDNVVYDGTPLDKVIFNGVTVWERLVDFTYNFDSSNGIHTLTGWNGTKDGVESTELIIPETRAIDIAL